MRNLQLLLISLLCIVMFLPLNIMPNNRSIELTVDENDNIFQYIKQNTSEMELLFTYNPSE
ncbi:MAG: hypothetical protein ACFFC6_05750, partial [Promethearchaeota archaeon]